MATPDLPVHVHTTTHRERCDAAFHAAFAYSRDVAGGLEEAGYDVTDYWFHRDPDDSPFEGAIVIGNEDEVYSWHADHGWSHRAGPPGQWGPYKTVRPMGLGADTPAEDVVAAIVEGRAPAAPEPRVFVAVSAPGGADPEDTAQAIALAVQKVAPGADVYTTTSKEDQLKAGRAQLARAMGEAQRRVRELEEENQRLRGLVGDLAGGGTCWYDHHGYCQEHMWFATEPPCPHARAREITKGGT